jgi:hypothetical protein
MSPEELAREREAYMAREAKRTAEAIERSRLEQERWLDSTRASRRRLLTKKQRGEE